MLPIWKLVGWLGAGLLIFGCAQVEKGVKSVQDGFVQGYEETKKAIFPEDSKPKPTPKAPEAKKPPSPDKPKDPPEPVPAPPKDLAPPPVKKPVVDEFISHKVMAGETIASIARWYSGKTTTWKEIVDYNTGLDPFKLKEGQTIKIPQSMATVHKEQPDHSTAAGPSPGKKTTRETKEKDPPVSPPDSEAKPVFGPK